MHVFKKFGKEEILSRYREGIGQTSLLKNSSDPYLATLPPSTLLGHFCSYCSFMKQRGS
jgi:hypothetical protein